MVVCGVTVQNASRLALKAGEHTWGKDVKSNLQDNAHWTNADFNWARTVGPLRNQYAVLEQSWCVTHTHT